MKKKLLWVVVAVFVLTVTVLIVAGPRFLSAIVTHGDPPPPRESFEEMVNHAELIVLTDVKSVKKGPDWVVPTGHPDSVDRVVTRRITLEVVKVYKGDVSQGQILTLVQWNDGITRSYQFPIPAFQINENDPIYKRGEQYILMLIPVFMPEEYKPYQPEPWQEGMFSVVYPEGRIRLNRDGTVTSVLDSFGINGKSLEEIEQMIANTVASLPSGLSQAREALITYFSLLHSQRYDEATYFFGGSYDLLRDWNPAVDPNDNVTLLKNGCTINGLMCLEVGTVVQEEEVSPDEFKFVVEFLNEDGSIFVSGPEASPQSQFKYTVMKADVRFLIQNLPVFAP